MDFIIERSFRKTISLGVKYGQVVVKAPYFTSKKYLREFVEKHRDWITRQLEKSQAAQISPREVELLKKEAKKYIPLRTEELANIHGKEYQALRITSAKTRWGSCSSKKNLNFSYRLMHCPKEVIDYVIIHELAHLKHMNHS